jgi:hypothetical protein
MQRTVGNHAMSQLLAPRPPRPGPDAARCVPARAPCGRTRRADRRLAQRAIAIGGRSLTADAAWSAVPVGHRKTFGDAIRNGLLPALDSADERFPDEESFENRLGYVVPVYGVLWDPARAWAACANYMTRRRYIKSSSAPGRRGSCGS